MANEPLLTLVGNVTGDPQLRTTQSGISVAGFDVASTPRTLNKQTDQWEDGEPMFVRCSAWRELGENVANTLSKGMRVIVTGKLTVRSYEHQGQQRTSLELLVDEVGPSLRYATAQVSKAGRNSSQNGGQGAPGGSQWGTGAPGALQGVHGGSADDYQMPAHLADAPPF